jgi:hypothetical protein
VSPLPSSEVKATVLPVERLVKRERAVKGLRRRGRAREAKYTYACDLPGETAVCLLARFAPDVPCDGQLVRCHLISKQVLRREVWPRRAELAEAWEQYGWGSFPRSLRELCEMPATWVPGCGGLCGCDGHHGMLDRSRKLRIPFEELPSGTVRFAEWLGLMPWLEREYRQIAEAA